MRTPVLFLFLAMISFTATAQKRYKRKSPPGTVQVNDSLYIDITEVANIHWREYLFYLQQFDSLSYELALPDTLVWQTDTGYTRNEPQDEFYLRHPGFNDYPVVGISYQQAIAFCKWRTFAANFNDYCKENKIRDWRLHTRDSFPIRYYYRLPTKMEWEMIAAGNLSLDEYPFGITSTQRKGKSDYIYTVNCIYPDAKTQSERGFYTAPIKSFFPNNSGVYNMVGNVSEMVAEEGIAKGGSFLHALTDCRVRLDQAYIEPQKWLGFRCVAVWIK